MRKVLILRLREERKSGVGNFCISKIYERRKIIMKGKKILALLLACAMVLGSMSVVAFADDTMSFNEFVKAVENGDGTFDGDGITVEWTPESGCGITNGSHTVETCPDKLPAATASTPHKVNSKLAQFWIFEGLDNIEIKNVNFKYNAADFKFCHDERSISQTGSIAKADAPTAQLHMYNKGNVTLEGCTFDNVVATPWNLKANNVDASTRTISVEGCTFKNIPGSYGLKDVQAGSVTIANNTFENTRSGIMLSSSAAKTVKISGNKFNCNEENGDLIQIAKDFTFNDDSDMSVIGNSSANNTGVFRIMNSAVKNITVSDNDIPSTASWTSSNSDCDALIDDDGNLTAKGWGGAEGTTVEYNGSYYKTLAEALAAVFVADDDNAVINCKKGAEVGKLSHAHVSNNIVINGNGAKVTSGGDQDLEVDTYYYSRSTGKLVDPKNVNNEKTLDKNIKITVNNLSGIAVWGQRTSGYTVDVELNDCKNLNRIYISGKTGVNNYTLNNCTFDSDNGSHPGTSVYSNNPGTININNCSFKGIALACNFNNKSEGTQNITLNGCTIIDCATEAKTESGWKAFTAPVRFVTSGTGAKTVANVENTSISYTEGNKNVGNGDILLGEGRKDEKSYSGVTLNTSGVDADVQIQFPGQADKTEKISVKADAPSTIEIPAVAEINGAKFADLESAFAAVKTGDTVTLLDDVTLSDGIYVTNTEALKGFVFDGNGHTISYNLPGKTALQFGTTKSYYNNGVEIKNLNMTGKADFAVEFCGGKIAELTNVNISGDYLFALNLYGTSGATVTDSEITNVNSGKPYPTTKFTYVACGIWANVAAANPLKLVNSNVDAITVNGYTASNVKAPKIIVDKNSKVKIYSYEDDKDSGSTTKLLCLSAKSEGDVTVQKILNDNAETISEPIVPVASVGDIYYDTMEAAEEAAAASGETVIPYTGAEKVSVLFEKSENDSSVYDICIKAEDKIINRLTSAEFAFELTSADDISYDITGAENVSVKEENGKYLFNFNGVKADATGTKIKIGQAAFTGYGKFSFAVTGDKNIVNATTVQDNIVTSYIANPSAVNEGTLDTSDRLTDVELKPETAALTVDVIFNNPVGNQIATYQDMKVTVSGGDLAAEKEFAIGSDENEVANGQASITTELTENIAYTVTVTGAGYRTARHTVTMSGDKTLTFWNNVLDTAKAVEEGKTAVTKNFLAGDIVKDSKINIYDLSAVVSYYGRTNDTATADVYAKYDLNRDGVIDSKDVSMVLVSWGE